MENVPSLLIRHKLNNLSIEQYRQLTLAKDNWWTASSLSVETEPQQLRFASLSPPLVCSHLSNYLNINTYHAQNEQFLSLKLWWNMHEITGERHQPKKIRILNLTSHQHHWKQRMHAFIHQQSGNLKVKIMLSSLKLS